MASRSSEAFEVSSTRNAVFFAELIEDLVRWAGASGGNVFQASADAFAGICFVDEVEEVLMGGGVVLKDGDELGDVLVEGEAAGARLCSELGFDLGLELKADHGCLRIALGVRRITGRHAVTWISDA
jgi:hypothetical protein